MITMKKKRRARRKQKLSTPRRLPVCWGRTEKGEQKEWFISYFKKSRCMGGGAVRSNVMRSCGKAPWGGGGHQRFYRGGEGQEGGGAWSSF